MYLEDNHKHDHLFDVYVSFSKGVHLFKSSKLSNQKWKHGWPKEGETAEFAWVHVYGLYYEETNYGGYGVTVRNMAAEPIAASVYFSLYWSNLSLSSVEGIRCWFQTCFKTWVF